MKQPIDFEAIFENAPNPYMVLDRDLRYVAVNAAYLEVTASRREDLIGRGLFESFPNDPNDPQNVPARMLRQSLERVLSSGQRDHLAYIPYRVPKRVGDRVVEEDRYWSATHTPILDPSGRVGFILQHTVDVTELHAREVVDRTGARARDEAGILGRARAVQEENARIAKEREHLRALFAQAPGFMCVLEGPEHVFRLANEAYLRMVGDRPIVGLPLRQALPEVIGQGFADILDQVYRTGEPFVGRGIRVVLQRTSGSAPEERFVDFVYQPVFDEGHRPRGIFVQGNDVTVTKRTEQEREAARRAAEAFSEELQAQSREVLAALERANRRIAELEAALGPR